MSKFQIKLLALLPEIEEFLGDLGLEHARIALRSDRRMRKHLSEACLNQNDMVSR